jgi:hypothetical protein
MFLLSVLLIVAGAVIMDAYYAPGLQLEFGAGLFTVMGGVILWAISLNYGTPPATKPLGPLEAGRSEGH